MVLGLVLSGCVSSPSLSPQCQRLLDAAMKGTVQDVAASLDAGIMIDDKCSGSGALGSAAYYGNTDVVKFLLDRGASIESANALSSAAFRRHTKIVKILIAKGADIQNAIDQLERRANGSVPYAAQGNADHIQQLNDSKAGTRVQPVSATL